MSDFPRAVKVVLTREELRVDLDDGRHLRVPLAWFPRLFHATARQRTRFELIDDGEGIRWPDVDEDLSVAGLLRGTPAPGGRVSRRRHARRAPRSPAKRAGSVQLRRAPRRPGR
jgi:hypothetical protein